jgi:hypothetical protein
VPLHSPLPLWPTVGAAWRPNGSPEAVLTPGPHAKPSRAGALPRATGDILHGRRARKPPARCRDGRLLLEHADPAPRITRLAGVMDHDGLHQAQAVEPWIARHPRWARLWWPTSCPRATPLARAVGDMHDPCTRHHTRKRLRDGVSAVERHLRQNGPWLDTRSQLYDAPEVTAAVERIAAAERVKVAA